MLVKYTVSEFLSAKGSFSSIDKFKRTAGKPTLTDQFKKIIERYKMVYTIVIMRQLLTW